MTRTNWEDDTKFKTCTSWMKKDLKEELQIQHDFLFLSADKSHFFLREPGRANNDRLYQRLSGCSSVISSPQPKACIEWKPGTEWRRIFGSELHSSPHLLWCRCISNENHERLWQNTCVIFSLSQRKEGRKKGVLDSAKHEMRRIKCLVSFS